MMTVTSILVTEHRLIQAVLHLLYQSREKLEHGRPVPGVFFETDQKIADDLNGFLITG